MDQKAQHTMLEIPAAHRQHALANGASCDEKTGQWYVVGDVPVALLSYVAKAVRVRDYTLERSPACPLCHSKMVLRESKAGDVFWGCQSFPRCKGSRPATYSVQPHDDDTDVAHPAVSMPTSSSASAALAPEVVSKIAKLQDLCHVYMPHALEMKKWLVTPRVRFQGRSAIDVMTSLEGCQHVEDLLHETFRPQGE